MDIAGGRFLLFDPEIKQRTSWLGGILHLPLRRILFPWRGTSTVHLFRRGVPTQPS